MPAKNSVKTYQENSYYHVYNRGVEKRDVFCDEQDYRVFLSYLQTYLSDPKKLPEQYPSHILSNFNNNIELLCYCLMPNHFHFLIHQHYSTVITDFMRSLFSRYSVYFNKKYDRVGSLFQGKYKAVLIKSEEQLVYITHYLHNNPRELFTSRSDLEVLKYRYSSIGNYLGRIHQDWVRPKAILELFSTTNPKLSYRSFVTNSKIISGFDLADRFADQ